MHVTTQKPLDEIISSLKPGEKVFVVGCGKCATKCHTGGEPETEEMAERLRQREVNVVGRACTSNGVGLCKLATTKKMLIEEHQQEAEIADSFLTLSCKRGFHTVINATNDSMVHPGCNTLFDGKSVSEDFLTK